MVSWVMAGEPTMTMVPAGGWPTVDGSPTLLVVISLAAVITGLVFAISAVAYYRRRSRQYLIVTIALFALWLRSIIGALTVFDLMPMYGHHLIEHALDATIGILVLYAVYAHAPGAVGDDR